MKLDPYLLPCTKIYSKWIRHSIVKAYSINFLEENIGVYLGLHNGLLYSTSKAQAKKKKIDILDLTNIKNICSINNTINKKTIQPTEWERLFTSPISNKWHVHRIHKEPLQCNNIKWGNNIHRKFKKRNIQFLKT